MSTASSRIVLAPESQVGAYRVVRELGAGGMGAVYEAVHSLLNKRVALKLMHGDLCERPDLHERFLREGRAAVAIHHPHVVNVSDVGFHEGVPYLVMDFLEGSDLHRALRERGRYPVVEACDVLLPVVAAVAAAHDAGVIHRDLKPENVFLVRPARHDRAAVIPTVVDFGIARLVEGSALTTTHAIMGSPAYMSPEQCDGQASPASDQWALGVMLYELCTGQHPFHASTPITTMYKICTAAPAPLSSHGVAVPQALVELIERALRKDPAARFPSVRALGAALLPHCSAEVRERHAHELLGAATAPAAPRSAAEPAVREPTPRPALALIAALLAVLALSVGLVLRTWVRPLPVRAIPLPAAGAVQAPPAALVSTPSSPPTPAAASAADAPPLLRRSKPASTPRSEPPASKARPKVVTPPAASRSLVEPPPPAAQRPPILLPED